MKQLLLFIFLSSSIASQAQNDTTIYGYVDSVTFKQTEIAPAFPWGPTRLQMYLNQNMQYPQEAIDKKIEGTVVVEFMVWTDGHLSDIKVFKSDNSVFNEEAIRLIQKSRWVPAVQNGRNANYRMRQPIIFKL